MSHAKPLLLRSFIFSLALLLVACASTAPAPAGLAARAELENVAFFPAAENHFYAAQALATALSAAGMNVDAQALQSHLNTPSSATSVALPAPSALQTELLAAARRNGLVAIPIPARVDAVQREIAAGHAVLVLLNTAEGSAPQWHYAVAVGFDLNAQHMVLRSSKERRLLVPLASFERQWARAQHWGFSATTPDTLPATATQKETQQALMAYERVATPKQAAVAYSAAAQKWPDNGVLRMGLGNSLHAAGDKARAAQVYEKLATEKNSGAAWVNLSMTYAQLGKTAKAYDAAQQALATGEPWAAKAKEILQKLNSGASGNASGKSSGW